MPPLLQLLFTWDGRISRRQYWLAVTLHAQFAAAVLAVYALIVSGMRVPALAVAALAALTVLVSNVFTGIKRLHDRDRSGWWLLVFHAAPALISGAAFIPFLLGVFDLLGAIATAFAIVLLAFGLLTWGTVELALLRGTAEPNRFGDDPIEPRSTTLQPAD